MRVPPVARTSSINTMRLPFSGTLEASRTLLERAGADVAGLAVVLEVQGLKGRDRLTGLPLYVVATGEMSSNGSSSDATSDA